MLTVFVPKEIQPGETRVAITPETTKHFVKAKLAVRVERGAAQASSFRDEDLAAAGAELVDDAAQAWKTADVVLKVAPPSPDEAARLKAGALLVSFVAPHRNSEAVRKLAAGNVSTLAMELVPRITRAQTMDALSSQASIAGYKAAVLAASRLGKYFPLLMTAAGTIPPSRVVVMGAGVAGLQALATAKRLGAIVEVSDIREAVKEQVQSLGGRFIELPMKEGGEGAGGYAREMTPEFLAKQREIVAEHVANADVVITTALVPGKPAPRLVTREMVERMRAGSVIIDLAAPEGGNCELSQPDHEVVHHGVTILAPTNLVATLAHDASLLYSRNVQTLLLSLLKDGQLNLDTNDEVVAGTLLTHAGSIVHEPTATALAGAA